MQSKEGVRIRLQFGKHLRNLRIQAGITQFDLASRAKISVQYLQNLEGKKPKNPSLETLYSLAKALGVPLGRLMQFDR